MKRPTTDEVRSVSVGALAGFLGYALRRAQLAVFESFTRALGPCRLTPAEFGVLIVIDANQGLRSTDVCNALGFQKANFAPLLRRLEGRGVVRRVVSTGDRRAQLLELTGAGRRLLARAMRVHEEHERASLAALSAAEVQLMISLLGRVATRPEQPARRQRRTGS